jgi:hypothetical protein
MSINNIANTSFPNTLSGLDSINVTDITINGVDVTNLFVPYTGANTNIDLNNKNLTGVNNVGTTTLIASGLIQGGNISTSGLTTTNTLKISSVPAGTVSSNLAVDSSGNVIQGSSVASQVNLALITSGINGNYYPPLLRYDVSGNQVLYVDTQYGTFYYNTGTQTFNAINITANNAVSGLTGSFGTVTTSSSITATGSITSSSFVSSGTSNLQNATISALTVSSSATLPQFITFSTAPSSGTAASFLALNSLNQIITATGISAQPTVTATNTNASFYPIFAPNNTTTSSSPIYVDTGGSLNYNPSTKVLYSSNFYGSNITTASATLVNSSGSLTELINTVAGTYYTGTLVGDIIFQSSNGAWWGVASGNTFNILVNSVKMLSVSSTGVALTNTPTAPTAAVGTNTSQLATTAFCSNGFLPITGSIGGVNANYGLSTAFNITNSTFTLTVFSATPTGVALLGTVTAPTKSAGDNTTAVATTAFVTSAVGAYLPLTGGTMTGAIVISSTDLTFLQMSNNKFTSYTYSITDTGTNGTTTWFQFRTPASLASPAITALLTIAQPTVFNSYAQATELISSDGTAYLRLVASASNNYIQSGVAGTGGSYAPLLFTSIGGTVTYATLTNSQFIVSVQGILLNNATNPYLELTSNYVAKATSPGSFLNDSLNGDMCINSRTGNIRLGGGSQYANTAVKITGVGMSVGKNVGQAQSTYGALTLNSGYSAGAPGGFCIDAGDNGSNTAGNYRLHLYPYVIAGGQVGYQFQAYNNGSTNNALKILYDGGISITGNVTYENTLGTFFTGGRNWYIDGTQYGYWDPNGGLGFRMSSVGSKNLFLNSPTYTFLQSGATTCLYTALGIYSPAWGSQGTGVVIGDKPNYCAIQMTYAGGTQGYLTIGATYQQYTVYQPGPTSGIYGFSYNWGATGFGFPSDRRLKDQIEPIPNQKENFMKLKPCQYHYKSDEEQKKRFGFVAQELQEVYPDAVYQSEITEKDDDGNEFKPLLLTQTNLIPIMVDQIQQLHKTVDLQSETIALLTKHLSDLTNQVNELTKQMKK